MTLSFGAARFVSGSAPVEDALPLPAFKPRSSTSSGARISLNLCDEVKTSKYTSSVISTHRSHSTDSSSVDDLDNETCATSCYGDETSGITSDAASNCQRRRPRHWEMRARHDENVKVLQRKMAQTAPVTSQNLNSLRMQEGGFTRQFSPGGFARQISPNSETQFTPRGSRFPQGTPRTLQKDHVTLQKDYRSLKAEHERLQNQYKTLYAQQEEQHVKELSALVTQLAAVTIEEDSTEPSLMGEQEESVRLHDVATEVAINSEKLNAKQSSSKAFESQQIEAVQESTLEKEQERMDVKDDNRVRSRSFAISSATARIRNSFSVPVKTDGRDFEPSSPEEGQQVLKADYRSDLAQLKEVREETPTFAQQSPRVIRRSFLAAPATSAVCLHAMCLQFNRSWSIQ